MINKKSLANSNVLLIDNASESLDSLTKDLNEIGVKIAIVTHAEKALELVKSSQPDVILLDIKMLDICQHLKEGKTKNIPVIFMINPAITTDKKKGFEAGGVDYIVKPLEYEDVLARLYAHITICKQQQKIEQMQKLLEETTRQLNLNKIDPLTQLPTRRAFLETLKAEVKRCNRHSSSFAIILANIDNFKVVNKTYGFDCGDSILEEIATNLKKMMRQYDQIARWGRDEFIVLLPETSPENGKIVAEGIRTAIKNTSFEHKGKQHSITMTLGVSSYVLNDAKFDHCAKRAHIALFEGRQKGHDCVYVD